MESRQLAARFWKNLFTLTDLMRDRTVELNGFAKSWNITIQQLRLLRTVERLTRTNYPDGIMLKTLAEVLSVSPAAVSGMVETMVKRNYLMRTQSADDRRSVRIRLSQFCCDKMIPFEKFHTGLAQHMCRAVGEERFAVLADGLENLVADFEKNVPHEPKKQS